MPPRNNKKQSEADILAQNKVLNRECKELSKELEKVKGKLASVNKNSKGTKNKLNDNFEEIGVTETGITIYTHDYDIEIPRDGKKKNKIETVTEYYVKFHELMDTSFSSGVSIGTLLTSGKSIYMHGGGTYLLINEFPKLFNPNSQFMTVHWKSIVEFCRDNEDVDAESVPWVIIEARPQNGDTPFTKKDNKGQQFVQNQIQSVRQGDTHYVGVYYDNLHDTIRIVSGSIAHANETSQWWIAYECLLEDEYQSIDATKHIQDLIDMIMEDDYIVNNVYEPNVIWIDHFDQMRKLMSLVIQQAVSQVMIPKLRDELKAIEERKQEILDHQKEESQADEKIPDDLPVPPRHANAKTNKKRKGSNKSSGSSKSYDSYGSSDSGSASDLLDSDLE